MFPFTYTKRIKVESGKLRTYAVTMTPLCSKKLFFSSLLQHKKFAWEAVPEAFCLHDQTVCKVNLWEIEPISFTCFKRRSRFTD